MNIKVRPKIYGKSMELALKFTDPADVPKAFRDYEKGSYPDIDLGTGIGRRLIVHVVAWIETVEAILKHHKDERQAWRFINLSPVIDSNSAATCTDFRDFNTFLIKRRGEDSSSPEEIGGLCMLITEFQKQIERELDTTESIAI